MTSRAVAKRAPPTEMRANELKAMKAMTEARKRKTAVEELLGGHYDMSDSEEEAGGAESRYDPPMKRKRGEPPVKPPKRFKHGPSPGDGYSESIDADTGVRQMVIDANELDEDVDAGLIETE